MKLSPKRSLTNPPARRRTRKEEILTFFTILWKDESAEVAIEYGLLVGLLALAMIAIFNLLGIEVGNFFSRIADRFENLPSTPTCCD